MTTPRDNWNLADITAEDGDAEHLRTKALDRILALSEADFAAWMTVHDVDGLLYYSPLICRGDSKAPQMWRDLPGRPAAGPIQTGVRYPTSEERDSFQPVGKRALLAGFDDPMEYSACRDIYEPHGIGDEARMLVFCGRKFVGWIGVLRWKDRPKFSPAEIDRLDATAGWVKAGLSAAYHLESEEDEADTMFLLATADAKILHASEGVRDWLTQRRREDLRDILAQFKRDGQTPVVLLHGMELRISAMDGPEGHLHFLVQLIPAPVPSMATDAVLTPTQRVVADYALGGATVAEIARTMGRSPHTVKHHLKNIYATLGIGSRVELASAIDNDDGIAGT